MKAKESAFPFGTLENTSGEYLSHLGMGSRVEKWPLEKRPPFLLVPHLLELTETF